MSSKENAAVSQLLALLEARYALRVLWAPPGRPRPDLPPRCRTASAASRPIRLNTRIKELREAGLVNHGSEGCSLTLSGQDLLKRLSDLQAFAGKWQQTQVKKTAPPPPPPRPTGRRAT